MSNSDAHNSRQDHRKLVVMPTLTGEQLSKHLALPMPVGTHACLNLCERLQKPLLGYVKDAFFFNGDMTEKEFAHYKCNRVS